MRESGKLNASFVSLAELRDDENERSAREEHTYEERGREKIDIKREMVEHERCTRAQAPK